MGKFILEVSFVIHYGDEDDRGVLEPVPLLVFRDTLTAVFSERSTALVAHYKALDRAPMTEK